MAAAVATAQAAPVNRPARKPLLHSLQQCRDVLGPGRCRATLKLHRLAWTRISPDCNGARLRIGAEQIADEEVATMKLVEVFVDDQAHKEVPLRPFLVLRRKVVISFGQYLVGGPVPDF